MGRIRRLCAVIFLLVIPTAAIAAARLTQEFDSGWVFLRSDPAAAERPDFDDRNWTQVQLPHTWNRGDPPQKGYYRGPGWYRKRFATESDWSGRRVFIRFQAASLVARVYLNGHCLGEHRGGFTAFAYELTAYLRPSGMNVLAVRVDNSRQEDVIPLGGDFTIYGGLYRPVSLLVTDPIDITPLDSGSPGVFVHPVRVSADLAEFEVTAELSNGAAQGRRVAASFQVRSAGGRVLCSAVRETWLPAYATRRITVPCTLVHPHLWNGVADPYLHRVDVSLSSGGRTLDAVRQTFGLRSFAFDPTRGFILNGRAEQIHGVSLHQDWAGVGWAVSPEQESTDIGLIRQLGATGVRLAHYPHSDHIYELCDRAGLLVWAEIPLINDVRPGAAFEDNARRQLTEFIRQQENHPCIVLWSLYNEISPTNPTDPVPIVAALKATAQAEDSSRPVTGALSMEGIGALHQLGMLDDVPALNSYPGWYFGVASDLGPVLDHWNRAYGNRGLMLSEYGAGASIHQHDEGPPPRGRAPRNWHPEEWQASIHEQTYAAIVARPEVPAAFVWTMFDFASANRHEGDTPGINDKGLVTRDRRTFKDAFYFYQANWSAVPMVHIDGRRDDPRHAAETSVKVYSNCARVALALDGRPLGAAVGSPLHVFVWPRVLLRPGPNRLVAEGTAATGAVVRDACVLTLTSKSTPSHTQRDIQP